MESKKGQGMILATERNVWDDYILTVEHLTGRRITDGRTVDMLYALYLNDIEADLAAAHLDDFLNATGRVKEALDALQDATTTEGLASAYRTIQRDLLANRGSTMREFGNPIDIMPVRRRPQNLFRYLGAMIIAGLVWAALMIVLLKIRGF